MQVMDRFFSSIQKVPIAGCWIWIGSLYPSGYGRMKIKGKIKLAHRLSWEINVGEIPKGKLVCHKCDVPACVNPDHLFIGTQKENLADRKAKGRFHPVRGIRHGMAKLTQEQVEKIILDKRRPQRIIAEDYGVSNSLINYIQKGKSWKHLR